MGTPAQNPDYFLLAEKIKTWARALGFQQLGIADTDLTEAEAYFSNWLARGRHGEMAYMARHGTRRSRPEALIPGTWRVISVRMDYRPETPETSQAVLDDAGAGFIARYALGRDYHKLVRKRLQKLAARIAHEIGGFRCRVFADSAPVLEKALAEKAGLGWIGKHTNLLHRRAGSWFFLGEIYTDLPLPVDRPASNHCGQCTACIDSCPTGAIVAPYELDARRCIAYLTIELRGSIPVALRPLIGNRIFGCDDCQAACPWNRFAVPTEEQDFLPRGGLDAPTLIELFSWDETRFLRRTEGSAIRRIGYVCWLRNIAVALGNAPTRPEIISALQSRSHHLAELVREHVVWALGRHRA